jgi:hypothetical protein
VAIFEAPGDTEDKAKFAYIEEASENGTSPDKRKKLDANVRSSFPYCSQDAWANESETTVDVADRKPSSTSVMTGHLETICPKSARYYIRLNEQVNACHTPSITFALSQDHRR